MFESIKGKQFPNPQLQNNQKKWARDMARAIEHLLCKP
jgi:hypothetical protein